MLAAGRLAKRGRKYPTVWMADKRVRPASSKPSTPKATGLKAALRAFRSREAKRKRWKPYQVFPDAVVDAIVHSRPASVQDLLDLPGIGPTRVRRYSQALLELVSQHPE